MKYDLGGSGNSSPGERELEAVLRRTDARIARDLDVHGYGRETDYKKAEVAEGALEIASREVRSQIGVFVSGFRRRGEPP